MGTAVPVSPVAMLSSLTSFFAGSSLSARFSFQVPARAWPLVAPPEAVCCPLASALRAPLRAEVTAGARNKTAPSAVNGIKKLLSFAFTFLHPISEFTSSPRQSHNDSGRHCRESVVSVDRQHYNHNSGRCGREPQHQAIYRIDLIFTRMGGAL